MKLNHYQKQARKTAIYKGKKEFAGLAYTTLGLTGEAGEFANKVKKVWRDDNGKLNLENRMFLRMELGGVLWYLSQAAAEIGYDLETIAKENLAILKDRKKRGKLKGSGDKR